MKFKAEGICKIFEITKGQLISKCPYEKSVSSKIPTKIFLGLPGDLVSNIINKEGYWKPKKLPGSPQKTLKKFRAEIVRVLDETDFS